MHDNDINKTLGLTQLPINYDEAKLPATVEPSDAKGDVEYVRGNLFDAVSVAQQAMQDMLAIAQQSQHPKAYEALNAIIKTYADISTSVADLQIKKQRITGKKSDEDDTQIVNNNLFIGSTAELQKMLESMKK